jgi:hypothetical protein
VYRITGADGKEYGPIDLAGLRQWVADGRVNGRTKINEEGASEWKVAAEVPELQEALSKQRVAASAGTPPPMQAPPASGEQQGLAIASLVLGILSLVCFGLLTGIPAIICGHLARGRARRSPTQYGGAGMAIAGLILGYLSIVISLLILPALLLPALARAKERAQSINCVNNMKQIGLAFRVWGLDHESTFPFNVSTNSGGTMEASSPGPDGFDQNPVPHFQVLSNQLNSTKVLVCVADASKHPAIDFQNLQAANISYRLRTGTNVNDGDPLQVLAVCPIHHNELFCNGSVKSAPRRRLRRDD